ncbi:MAG TPA: hypothetical protein VGE52_12815 [Pirellulales bacterium]
MNAPAPRYTASPWRWEVNLASKRIQLCGGRPRFDLTLMDFVRWGMGSAAPRFREDVDHMNLLHRFDRWAVVDPARPHHADWHRLLDHPDARLIEKAPELLEAGEIALAVMEANGLGITGAANTLREVISKAKGGAV